MIPDNKPKKHQFIITIATISVIFAACNITQLYKQPANVASNKLYRDVVTTDTVTMAKIPWKQLFTDTLLQSLIAEGLRNNFDLKIATVRIQQANANFKQSQLAFLPSLSTTATGSLINPSANQINNKEQYEVYAGASWEIDIWGKLKSSKRAALAALLQSDAYKREVQTQLIANIAQNYFLLMAYDAQLQITLKTLENRKKDVEAMKILKESDVVTGAAVVQSQANRYSVEVTIPDLKQNIRETENAICVLLGRDFSEIKRNSLSTQTVTTDLKTGLPSQLLSNRPDVQEAEYQFRNSFELSNVARTYFYPTLSISSQAGIYNTNLSQFFDASSFFANVMAGLTQPIFNNGLNKQRLNVAKAQQEEYLIAFKQSLLNAGQEVSNALYDYQAASDKINSRTQQIAFLQKAVDYTKELLKYTTATNYTDVLTSEQSLLAAELNSVNDKLQQLQAVVVLYRSLGGGWQ